MLGQSLKLDQPLLGDDYIDYAADEQEEEHGGTWLGSVFNLTNTILGSGTLCLPFVLLCSGWLMGLITMVVVGLVTVYSVWVLLHASDQAGSKVPQNYEGLGYHTLGRPGTYIAEFTFIFGGFGTLMSYFIFVSSLICAVFGVPDDDQKWVMVGCVVAVVMPLSCLRKLDALKHTSLLAIVTVVYVVACVVATAIGTKVGYGSSSYESSSAGSAPVAIQISSLSTYTFTLLITAFACHNTTLPVYKELKDKSATSMISAVAAAIGISFCLYLVVAVAGYIHFGSNTQDNILLNFTEEFYSSNPSYKWPVYIAKLTMALCLILSAPLANVPFRSCLLSVFLRCKNGEQTDSDTATTTEWIVTTCMSQGVILVCAINVPNVSTPLSIVGSVAGSLIIFILPGLFYLAPKLRRTAVDALGNEADTGESVCAVLMANPGPSALVLAGMLIGPFTLSLTLYKLIEGHALGK